MISCEIYETLKNTYFKEQLWTTDSYHRVEFWEILWFPFFQNTY